jgi:crotonobetainyl-CoA:carnitine CoA-transferase CaiB-like acyl-CoA transferase
MGILMALIARAKSGKGQIVEADMVSGLDLLYYLTDINHRCLALAMYRASRSWPEPRMHPCSASLLGKTSSTGVLHASLSAIGFDT